MRKKTEAQELLRVHLRELGYKDAEMIDEYQFWSERKWRFDLAIPHQRLAFECNGHWQGHHGAGWSQGAEKMNVAQMAGWRVLQFHNKDVLRGKVKEFMQHWIGKAR